MPCCTREWTPVAPASQPIQADLLVVSVAGAKLDLPVIHTFQDSVNAHPVQVGKLYAAESLQYLGLTDLRVSSGKFTATAMFRLASGKHNPLLARANWTKLLLALWSSDPNV